MIIAKIAWKVSRCIQTIFLTSLDHPKTIESISMKSWTLTNSLNLLVFFYLENFAIIHFFLKTDSLAICGILGKNKKLTSNRQSSWFHGDRFDGLWMVQTSQEDSLDAPWHFPRDFSDYHVKNLWSDTLGVRTRFYCFSSQNHFDWKNNRLRDWSYSIVFPVKMILTGKTIESGPDT